MYKGVKKIGKHLEKALLMWYDYSNISVGSHVRRFSPSDGVGAYARRRRRIFYRETNMTIRDVVKLLDAEILCGAEHLDTEIHTACGSDMMSDVLAYVKDQSVLLTGLLNPQVVRTAEMMDMLCIVFVRGKRPEQPVIELAREKGIVLLTTEKRLFVACGILYTNGLGG